MNIYDFDKTIYPTDCAVDFFLWCLKCHPRMWFTYVPKVVKNLILRKIGLMTEATMQREFFGYLTQVDDFEEQIKRYWDKNEKRIVSWYLAQKRPDDLIISASPNCIIEPIANRLGVRFMATDFDREFGVFLNKMKYAKEKARYIIDQGFPVIENFYSDSLSDTPLALLAEKAHLVKDHASTVVDWPALDAKTMAKVKGKINTGWESYVKED